MNGTIYNALLVFLGAAGIGFGGAPWAAFAIGAVAVVVFGLPGQLDTLKRYARQPKTDIIFVMVFEVVLAVGGAFVSAWAGFGLRLLLAMRQR